MGKAARCVLSERVRDGVEDVESVRAFAGERWQEAVITPKRNTFSGTPIAHYQVLTAQ